MTALAGYRRCVWCGLGQHTDCDGNTRIYHVGAMDPEVRSCECATAAHELPGDDEMAAGG